MMFSKMAMYGICELFCFCSAELRRQILSVSAFGLDFAEFIRWDSEMPQSTGNFLIVRLGQFSPTVGGSNPIMNWHFIIDRLQMTSQLVNLPGSLKRFRLLRIRSHPVVDGFI